MEKPKGYDEAQAFGDFESLEAGGYKCIIKKIADERTKNNKEYLKIAIDIAEGEHKDFYKRKFENDTRKDKKWSGVWTVFVDGYEPDTTSQKFKGLITSVEKSNEGFKFDFDEQKLVGKKIGIVFRDEEFEGQDGQIHIATKPFYATSYDKVESTKVPKIKTLNNSNSLNDFENIETDNDDLPF